VYNSRSALTEGENDKPNVVNFQRCVCLSLILLIDKFLIYSVSLWEFQEGVGEDVSSPVSHLHQPEHVL